jgi:hypothetical protein
MIYDPIDNPRYPHHIRIVRRLHGDWISSPEESQEVIVYDGAGRSYTDTTTTGDSKVDTNKRKASIPVRFDEWPWSDDGGCCCKDGDNTLVPMSGDFLQVTKGHIFEEGLIRDFEPDNDRSVVYGEMNRNLNMGG